MNFARLVPDTGSSPLCILSVEMRVVVAWRSRLSVDVFFCAYEDEFA